MNTTTWDTHTVETLRHRVETFIQQTVIPAEPAPGTSFTDTQRQSLQAKAKKAGVFAPHAPIEYGGLGLPFKYWSPIFQTAGFSPIGSLALNIMAPDEGNAHLLLNVGTAQQKKRYLTPLFSGDIRSCFGMTEPHPGAGSDPDALTSNATPTQGGWHIQAHKRFTSGAKGAAFCIVMARTPATNGFNADATLFLVDMNAPGVRIGKEIHTSDTAIAGGHPNVHFDNVFVTDDAVLGDPGQGFHYAQMRLGPARLTHCMRWLGLARRAQTIALTRAGERKLFGHYLGDLGLAQELIALSEIDIATSNAIINTAAIALEDDPRQGAALSSIAKVHCSQAIWNVIDRAIQLCGGDGVSHHLPLISYLNEIRPFRIYDGSTETHKWAIARRALRHHQRQQTNINQQKSHTV